MGRTTSSLCSARCSTAQTSGGRSLATGDNPAVEGTFFKEREARPFSFRADELKRLNQALLDEPDWRWRAFFPLSLFLGTRRGELMNARWADFDLNAGIWRIPDTKAGRPHLLALPKAAIEILKQWPTRNNSDWVFPGESKSGHMIEPFKAWQRIRQRAGLDGDEDDPKSAVRVHDLRRTLGSWLAASGYSLPLIGRALNHSNVSTTAIYARLNLDPVREALEHNAKMMIAVSSKSGAPAMTRPKTKRNHGSDRRNVEGLEIRTSPPKSLES
jgi:integrase